MSALPPLLALLASPALVGAQDLASTAAPTAFAGFGVHSDGTRLTGIGPGYRMDFEPGSTRFVPALGRRAPRILPLEMELAEVRVGASLVHAADSDVVPAGDDLVVEYRHTPDLIERYETRADGVELSFVLSQLPSRTGDLVVEMDVSTPLPLSAADPIHGLRFEEPELGGVAIGGVFGFDAAGKSVAGWIEWKNGQIELGLPAAFVATAELPLVLDPLIGPTVDVATGVEDDLEPDICRHSWFQISEYLVVWERHFSVLDIDIIGQRIGDDGYPSGSPILVAGSGNNTAPSVGALHATTSWLVAWEHRNTPLDDSDIRIVYVAGDGTLSQRVTLAGTNGVDELTPDVAAEDTHGYVVWNDTGFGIRCARTGDDGSGDPEIIDVFDVSADTTARVPAINQAHTTSLDNFIVWIRESGSSNVIASARWGVAQLPVTHDLYSSSRPLGHVDCSARDRGDYFVVWDEQATASTDRDVYGLRALYFGSSQTPRTFPRADVDVSPFADVHSPAIAYAVNQYTVATRTQSQFLSKVQARAIDCMTGAPLEGLLVVSTTPGSSRPAIACPASDTSSISGEDEAFLVWSEPGPNAGDILFQRVDGVGGDVSFGVQDGCSGFDHGYEGFAQVSSPTAGNGGFQLELLDAPPAAAVVLAISWEELGVPVGSAVVRPDLTKAVSFVTATDFDGYASVGTPIPSSLGGVTLWAQWLVFPNGWTECADFGVDFSDSVEFEIE